MQYSDIPFLIKFGSEEHQSAFEASEMSLVMRPKGSEILFLGYKNSKLDKKMAVKASMISRLHVIERLLFEKIRAIDAAHVKMSTCTTHPDCHS